MDDFEFGGFDYYNPGTAVSDFGALVDSTFFLNNTGGGGTAFTVAADSGGVLATGAFGAHGVSRFYEIASGQPVLITTTTLTNTGSSTLVSDFFETFDPDPSGTQTFMDVATTPGGKVAAIGTDTALLASSALTSPDADATESGGVFQINSTTTLADVRDTPFDGDGVFADRGMHLVWSNTLGAGESVSFVSYHSASLTEAGAIAALDNVVSPAPVPLPAGGVLLGSGLLIAGAWGKRRSA